MNNHVTTKALACSALLLALMSTAVRAADIVLSQILPLTGPIAQNGQGLMAGAKAYIDSVNAAGGVRGQKIVLKTYDDQYKPAETVRLVEKSIAEDHPLAFFNFTGAANIELLIKTGDLEKNKIALIGPRAGTQSLRNPVNPLIFHTYSSYWDEVERMVELFSSMGTTRFAVLYQDDSFGTDGFEGVQVALKKRNLPLTVAASYPRGTTDIAAAGAKIIAANPQAVIFCSTAPAAAAFVKHFRDQMVGVQFAGISAVDGATLVKLAGLKAAHGFVLAQNVPNPTKNSVALAREHHDVMAKFAPSVKPNFYTLGGYAAARVVVEGLRRAGPTPTREKFIAALEGIREFDIGGVQYTFGRGVRMGTKFVDLLIIDSKGEPQS
ncbi:MAG TPA: ABC transporter substrate-binding protein [Burkholderiales bacterium]|nr:ABC transporter substrate-binding protein [Burkholderiales bacterium]